MLPLNFRHEMMIDVTMELKNALQVYLDKMDFTGGTGDISSDQLKKQVEKVFVSRFWFTNMAWFNEMKRFFKLETRYINDDVADIYLADLHHNISEVAKFSPLINFGNFNLDFAV